MARRQNTRSIWPIILIAAGAVLLVGALIWLLSQNGAEQPPVVSASQQDQGIRRVSLADARAAWVNGSAVFVDVRGEQFYDAGHIPGAVSLPLEELPSRLNELNPDDWIITYCT